MQEGNIIPEEDSTRINLLINHETIRPWVAGDFKGVLDASILVNNRANIFFVSDHGGCGLIKIEDGVYELHSFVLPEGRGRWVKKNFDKVREWVFSNTPADRIVTMCPVNNRMAIGAARVCGFKKYGTIEKSWAYEGNVYDVDTYVLYKGMK